MLSTICARIFPSSPLWYRAEAVVQAPSSRSTLSECVSSSHHLCAPPPLTAAVSSSTLPRTQAVVQAPSNRFRPTARSLRHSSHRPSGVAGSILRASFKSPALPPQVLQDLLVHALRPLKSHVNPLCLWLLPQVCRVANNYSMTFRICGVGYMDPGVVLWLLGRRSSSLPGFIWCANPLSSSSLPPACSPPLPSVNAVIRDVLPTDRATHGVVDHLQHELPLTRQPSPPLRPRRKPEV
ncbi:hypothetical protein DFH08DRAFT_971102 [Mycena albidolilacea]|uniref:Uncharacterized protein n=1 Tax=Mycena albidolilacea TaxID=1033008 RepID=A0AAD6ZE28_9AGAR|nr:hypothetical protein DFH08DRAFT_971102 [Mycena albidolilacea]